MERLPAIAVVAVLLAAGGGGARDRASASDLGLTEADCRCCHDGGVPDRHHLLLATSRYDCMGCHWVPSRTDVPVVTRDCLLCHGGSLADRHHVVVREGVYVCLSCHAASWDEVNRRYVIGLLEDCRPPPPLERCRDGIDNDGDGLPDCADPDCDGAIGEATTCGVGVCAAEGHVRCQGGEAVDTCRPGNPNEPAEASCGDGLDNDCDGLADCADRDCAGARACRARRVMLCHKGKRTVTVRPRAVRRHLAHGDTMGACPSGARHRRAPLGPPRF